MNSGGHEGPTAFYYLLNFMIFGLFLYSSKIYPAMIVNGVAITVLYVLEANGANWSLPEEEKLVLLVSNALMFVFVAIGLLLVAYSLMKTYRKQVKELEETHRELTILSTTDELSGLFNRRFIISTLEQMFQENRNQLSLIMMDIDRFKTINDTYGHGVGDKVIARISQMIQENTRKTDICGRFGGEEFIVILNNTSLVEAKIVAESLRQKVEEIRWEDIEGRVTMSLGVHMIKKDDTLDSALESADHHLYAAKESGRNCVVS